MIMKWCLALGFGLLAGMTPTWGQTSPTPAFGTASNADSKRPFSSELEAGLKALERKHYSTAMRAFRPLADGGEPRAQNNMGILFERGWGVTQSYVEAMNWYRKAAAQEVADAQYLLGVLNLEGKGTRQDPVAAKSLFLRAARKGHVQAQFMAGYLFLNEDAGKPDLVGGHAWLLVAQGNGVPGTDELLAFTTHRLKQAQIDLSVAMARRCRSSQYAGCPR